MQQCAVPEEDEWKGVSHFYERYVDTNSPVVLRRIGQQLGWGAVQGEQKWTPKSFEQAGKGVQIQVALSNEECSSPTRKKVVELSEYASTLQREAGEGNEGVGYLKQFDVFAEIPSLAGALRPLDVFSPSTIGTHFLWMGPANSRTGLHTDDENGLLCQIYGSKRILLSPPDAARHCQANNKYDSGTVCFDTDLEQTPPDGVKVFAADLHEGDAVFIPRYWLHQLRSLSPSISMNTFASTPWELLRDGTPRLLLSALHSVGLYKRGNCVCHSS